MMNARYISPSRPRPSGLVRSLSSSSARVTSLRITTPPCSAPFNEPITSETSDWLRSFTLEARRSHTSSG